MKARQIRRILQIQLSLFFILATPNLGQAEYYYPSLVQPYSNPWAPYPAMQLPYSRYQMICPNGACGLTGGNFMSGFGGGGGGGGGYGYGYGYGYPYGGGGFNGGGYLNYQPYYYPVARPVYPNPCTFSVCTRGGGGRSETYTPFDGGLERIPPPSLVSGPELVPPVAPRPEPVKPGGEREPVKPAPPTAKEDPLIEIQRTDVEGEPIKVETVVKGPKPTDVPPEKVDRDTKIVVAPEDAEQSCLDRKKKYQDRQTASTNPDDRAGEAGTCPDGTCPGASAPISETNMSSIRDVNQIIRTQLSVAEAARKTLVTMYRNCKLADRENIICSTDILKGIEGGLRKNSIRKYADLKLLRGSHPLIPEGCKDYSAADKANSCLQPVCEKPPIFNYAGGPRSSVDPDGGLVLDLNNVGGYNKTTTGIDCTHAVCTFLAVAGLRCSPGESDAVFPYQTSQTFLTQAAQGTGCFNTVAVTGETPLRPGDVLVRNGHAMMIETLQNEKDPFGFAHLPPAKDGDGKDCSQVSVKHFKFTLIQSASNGDIGMQRIPASDFFAHGDTASRPYLEKIAEKACLAQYHPKEARVALKLSAPATEGEGITVMGVMGTQKNPQFAILRHKAASTAAPPYCLMKKPATLKGAECVGKCLGEAKAKPKVPIYGPPAPEKKPEGAAGKPPGSSVREKESLDGGFDK